jgi:hypothetical protein
LIYSMPVSISNKQWKIVEVWFWNYLFVLIRL